MPYVSYWFMIYFCAQMKFPKTIAACSMAAIMALQSLSLLFVQLEFSVSQPYIAKVLCVNRDKPQMKCDGKCFLTKELSRNADLETNSQKGVSGFNAVTLFIEQSEYQTFYPEKKEMMISFSQYYFDSGFLNSTERPPTA